MVTKTYWEQRQAAYFKAGREMFKIGAQILDDVVLDVEFTGSTDAWVAGIVKNTCDKARALFEKGHEEGIASNLAETLNQKAMQLHSDALTRYQQRKAAATAA